VLGSVTSHSLRDSEQKPQDESMSGEDEEEELHEQEPIDKEWFSKPSTPKMGTFNVN